MSVTSIDKDFDQLTLTLVADFTAPAERVWELWSDPRRLERWWGPPSYPATVETHDLRPGGEVSYYMTGPDGEKAHGYWRVLAVDAPRSLEFTDGFADENGKPDDSMPAPATRVELTERDGGTRMTMYARFASREDLQKVLGMGTEEGLRLAVEQMDALLD